MSVQIFRIEQLSTDFINRFQFSVSMAKKFRIGFGFGGKNFLNRFRFWWLPFVFGFPSETENRYTLFFKNLMDL